MKSSLNVMLASAGMYAGSYGAALMGAPRFGILSILGSMMGGAIAVVIIYKLNSRRA